MEPHQLFSGIRDVYKSQCKGSPTREPASPPSSACTPACSRRLFPTRRARSTPERPSPSRPTEHGRPPPAVKPVSYTHLDVYKRQGKSPPSGAAAMSAFAEALCSTNQELIELFPLFFAVPVYQVELEIPSRDFLSIRGFQQPYLCMAICLKFPCSGVLPGAGNSPMLASLLKGF